MTRIGSYQLVRLLGEGGMAKVYEARRGDETPVALKVFALAADESRFLRERFASEGRLLASLHHPRLVKVFESGFDEKSGSLYYAMELVRDRKGRSTTLRDVGARGDVTEARADVWYGDLRDVLGYCHAQGVVHRDVTLGNVLLDAADHAVLADFGVSRILDPALKKKLGVASTFVTGQTTGTRPVMGSYWFLAPEVRRGAAATPASDGYAFGVLFFRLLTGMWYEPSPFAFDLLAPYDPIWRARLAALLSEDPTKRTYVP